MLVPVPGLVYHAVVARLAANQDPALPPTLKSISADVPRDHGEVVTAAYTRADGHIVALCIIKRDGMETLVDSTLLAFDEIRVANTWSGKELYRCATGEGNHDPERKGKGGEGAHAGAIAADTPAAEVDRIANGIVRGETKAPGEFTTPPPPLIDRHDDWPESPR